MKQIYRRAINWTDDVVIYDIEKDELIVMVLALALICFQGSKSHKVIGWL